MLSRLSAEQSTLCYGPVPWRRVWSESALCSRFLICKLLLFILIFLEFCPVKWSKAATRQVLCAGARFGVEMEYISTNSYKRLSLIH